MATYEARKGDLEELGARVIAATVDDKETTQRMAEEDSLTFPIAYGVTEQQVNSLDPWWTEDHHGRYIQPMEFLILRGGTIFGSLYASGPVGRMGVDEVLYSIRVRERRRLES